MSHLIRSKVRNKRFVPVSVMLTQPLRGRDMLSGRLTREVGGRRGRRTRLGLTKGEKRMNLGAQFIR